MKFAKKFLLTVTIASFVFAGCTRYANDDELKVLNDTKAAANKADSKLSKLKDERKSLEDKLAEKETELKAAKEEKAAVEARSKESNN